MRTVDVNGVWLTAMEVDYPKMCCSPNSLLLGVLNSFLRCFRPFCHCWCPPFFRWPRSISIHLSLRLVSLLVGHCVRPVFIVSVVSLLFPFVSLCPSCLPSLGCSDNTKVLKGHAGGFLEINLVKLKVHVKLKSDFNLGGSSHRFSLVGLVFQLV